MQADGTTGGSGGGQPGSHEVVISLIPASAIQDDRELQKYRAARQAQADLSAQIGENLNQIAADRAEQQRQAARAQAIAAPEDPMMAAGGAAAAGIAQGAANTANGVQDGLIGTGNLIVRGVNYLAGYTVTPERASPDWSGNLFVSETDTEHDASKFLGGTGVSVLAGGGLGGVGRAGAGVAGPQTARMVVQANGQLAVATAGVAVTPAGAGVAAGVGIGTVGQVVQMSAGDAGSAPKAGAMINGVNVPTLTVSKDAAAMAREAGQVFAKTTQGWSAADKAAFWEALAKQIEAVHSPAWVSVAMKGVNGEYVFSGGSFGVHGLVIFPDGSLGIIGKTADVAMDLKTALVTVTRRPIP